jgi:hypothetical protein
MSTREGEITRTMIQGLKLLFRGPDNPLASHYKLCRRLMLGHKHRSKSTFVQRIHGSDSTWNYSVARASFHHARVSCYYWCWWSNWPSIHSISASITFIGRHSPCTLAAPYDYQNAVRVEYEIKFHLNLALKACGMAGKHAMQKILPSEQDFQELGYMVLVSVAERSPGFER